MNNNSNNNHDDDDDNNHLNFDSKCSKHYTIKGPVNSVATPIYTTSTYYFDSAQHGATLSSYEPVSNGQSQWIYSRDGNPTNEVAERMITQLEGGYGTHLFTSGMAAISTTILCLLDAGDHAIFSCNIYGGTHELVTDILPKKGVQVDMVDPRDINNYASKIKPNTKLMYGETPANPTLLLTDLEQFGQLGKAHDITTMIDSTFATPYNSKPISMGVDIVAHSATKYFGGHSDLLAGSITCAHEHHYKKLYQYVLIFGGAPSPFTGYLLQRGMKTLHLRMSRHNDNALQIARYLESHPKIEIVHYPGLESHPQHELAKKQMKGGYGGMIAFCVKGGAEAGRILVESVRLIVLAVSLGGVESLIQAPASMTHATVPKEDRERAGISDGLIRLSVGCENVNDLINDLDNALSKIPPLSFISII